MSMRSTHRRSRRRPRVPSVELKVYSVPSTTQRHLANKMGVFFSLMRQSTHEHACIAACLAVGGGPAQSFTSSVHLVSFKGLRGGALCCVDQNCYWRRCTNPAPPCVRKNLEPSCVSPKPALLYRGTAALWCIFCEKPVFFISPTKC